MDLRNAHVLITGASRGLGQAMARSFAEAGASLSLVARSADALRNLADELGCTFVVGDLLDDAFTDSLIERASTSGPVDVLINNAGMERVGHIADQSRQEIRDVLRLNLEVPAILTRDALASMIERGSGHIVNISSMAMAVNTPGFATYGASKSALSAFGGALEQELRESGVGLTTVEIGTADTKMLHDLRGSQVGDVFRRYERLGMSPLLDSDAVAAAVRSAVENGRSHVRMPKRQAALPMIVNAPRAIGNALTRGTRTQ